MDARAPRLAGGSDRHAFELTEGPFAFCPQVAFLAACTTCLIASREWPFVSGSHDGHWFLFLPQIMDGDQPRLNDQSSPIQRFMFLPADEATILDTWHTLGMRGTGSDDVVVSDLFIPERHTALLAPLEKPGTAYQGPLYRLTIWVPIALLAPPALGVARAAIDRT